MYRKKLLVTVLAAFICLQTSTAAYAAENTDIPVGDVVTEGHYDSGQEKCEEQTGLTIEASDTEKEVHEEDEYSSERGESAEGSTTAEACGEPADVLAPKEEVMTAEEEQEAGIVPEEAADNGDSEAPSAEEPAPPEAADMAVPEETGAGTETDAGEADDTAAVPEEEAGTDKSAAEDEEAVTAQAEVLSAAKKISAGRAQEIQVAYGWVTENGKRYYYGKNGKLHKGITDIDGKDYVLDPVTGELRKGLVAINGKVYHGSASGRLTKGWVITGGKKYYMDPDTGAAVTGFKDIGGRSYYFNGDGAAKQGVTRIGRSVYYFHPTVGYMLTGWREVNNRRYYFADKNVDNYKTSLEGRRLMGFTSIGGDTYYFTTSSMSGYKTCCYSSLATGLKEIAGEKYYFTGKGVMERSGWKTVDGERYHFNGDGIMDTGWKTEKGKIYHYTSGKKDTGWRKIGGKLYYFYHDGHMQDGGTAVIGGKRCAFNDSGACVSTNVTVLDVVEYAKYWAGKIPYKSSVTGNDPNNERFLELKEGRGSDCSWFVFHCFEKYGYLDKFVHSYEWGSCPARYRNGKEIGRDISDARPGDVICYAYGSGMDGDRRSTNSHVAIYIGNGRQVDCGAGIGVHISSVQYGSIYNIVRFSD